MRRRHSAHETEDDDFFEVQRTARFELPDPSTLIVNLARCVVEILAGARGLDQLSRWVTDDVASETTSVRSRLIRL